MSRTSEHPPPPDVSCSGEGHAPRSSAYRAFREAGGDEGPSLRDFPPPPKDLARWAFWVPFRDLLDPEDPERLRRFLPLWRLWYRAARGKREQLLDEYRRIFGDRWSEREYRNLLAEAFRVAFRVHLEECLMGRLDARTVGGFLELRGLHHLQEALDRGRGAIILSAHAGSFMLPIAALSLYGFPYTQYAARGLPPAEVARAHAHVLADNWWRRNAQRVKEENEDRLPAQYITVQTPVRELFRRLRRNELVALAFDGRVGNRWVRAPLLGREAILNPGAYRLSVSTGAPIVSTLCRTPRGATSICQLGRPLWPEGKDWRGLMRRFLEEHADPWLRHYPEEYGTWLGHCRLRYDIDDHPLFVDHATDDRWKRHPAL